MNPDLGNEDSVLRLPGQICEAGAVCSGQRLLHGSELVVSVIVPGPTKYQAMTFGSPAQSVTEGIVPD